MGHWFQHQKVVREYEEKISKLKTNPAPQPIGACAILVNSKGEILLGKRKNSYKAGYYGLPGGRIELNEPIGQAVAREVYEETGIKLDMLEYVGVVRENQGICDFIHFIYVSEDVTDIPQLQEPEKCEGWEWINIKGNTLDILPGHKAAIEMYFKKESFADMTTE
ncbi:MAG TPA: NUDIX domain-containing protein [Vitreimonas sp.]|nr:NUDIX domain-containing protein [Vitreimonas sp.]